MGMRTTKPTDRLSYVEAQLERALERIAELEDELGKERRKRQAAEREYQASADRAHAMARRNSWGMQ